jgi:membrane protease YdiL (CAAX protease family)
VTDISGQESRTAWLAVACGVIWFVAAASTGSSNIWQAIGGAAVVLGVAVLLLDQGLRTLLRPNLGGLLTGLATGGMMTIATYVLYPVVASRLPSIPSETALLYAAFRAPSRLLASLALGPVILGEGLVWRGIVQSALVRRLGPWAGVSAAAVAYALALVPLGSPVMVAVALLCGFVWGTLRLRTASLFPTLVAHLLWDGVVLFWLPLDAVH